MANDIDKLSGLFIEMQELLKDLIEQEVARMSEEEIKEIKKKHEKRPRDAN